METTLTSFQIFAYAFQGAMMAILCAFLIAFGIWLANRDDLWRGLAFIVAGSAFTIGMVFVAP